MTNHLLITGNLYGNEVLDHHREWLVGVFFTGCGLSRSNDSKRITLSQKNIITSVETETDWAPFSTELYQKNTYINDKIKTGVLIKLIH